jgi:hypothetical protein
VLTTVGCVVSVQVQYCGSTEQSVLCINARQVVQAAKQARADPTAPGVVVDITARPTTSLLHG